eukprot:6078162-Amphidinium_carterae.3
MLECQRSAHTPKPTGRREGRVCVLGGMETCPAVALILPKRCKELLIIRLREKPDTGRHGDSRCPIPSAT